MNVKMCKAVNKEGIAVKATYSSRVCVGGKYSKNSIVLIRNFFKKFINIRTLNRYYVFSIFHQGALISDAQLTVIRVLKLVARAEWKEKSVNRPRPPDLRTANPTP